MRSAGSTRYSRSAKGTERSSLTNTGWINHETRILRTQGWDPFDQARGETRPEWHVQHRGPVREPLCGGRSPRGRGSLRGGLRVVGGNPMLVNTAKSVVSRGGKMVFVSPQENVVKVLELVGVLQVIPIYTDQKAAIRGLQ
ncbi:MAG: STAS domain-containing protein [Marinilabiliales bacterium]|nr:STAS domain-containing protein [Marinilabiliales bacterium]